MGVTVAAVDGPATTHAAGVDANDWLSIVNIYRAQSGLRPVTANGSWDAGTRNHSCWMLLNGIAHDEAPGTPGYTTEGDEAGNSANVAVSSVEAATAKGNIDLWMSGPFHAVGILRANLTQSSYGQCSTATNPSATTWRSAGTLDVIRGLAPGGRPSTPIVFPGNGATTSLTRFVAESPDPRTFCGWSGQSVGLPLLALMPAGVSSAGASITGPNGPVATCVLHGANTTGIASSILGGENAIVIVPNAPLVAGHYSVAVTSDAGPVDWTFDVDPNAPLAPAEAAPSNATVLGSPTPFRSVTPFRFADSRLGHTLTRLPAGQPVRIQIAGVQRIPADVTALSANFTVAEPDAPGYLTIFNCAASVPQVSTLNYRPGEAIANQAVVALDRGALCAYSYAGAELIIDVNGYVTPSATSTFVPVDPRRLADTRSSGPLQPGSVLRLVVEGGASPAPLGSDAVALNLTATDAADDGWVRAFPCDAAEPGSSNVNVRRGGVRANSVIVPTAADGSICVTSNVTTNVIADITGYFGPSVGHRFVPLSPIRLADTRSFQAQLNPVDPGRPLAAGAVLRVQVAGHRGIPAGARAASLNLVALDSAEGGWLRVVPCGTPSDVSNLNYLDAAPVANGANVKLSADGAVCVTASQTSHVIVDINGVWF
ncbi:MAG: CAP domain-containing protein [Ilumatobacteraceae bacterium]